MRKTFLFFLLVLMALPGTLSAGTGRTGWVIMRKARSAKFKPVATTPVMAVRGDLSGVFYNPAVLALNPSRELFLLSEIGMADDTFAGAVYGHPVTYGSWAAGIIYYDAGDMELSWFDGAGFQSETVKAQRDIMAMLSYGFRYTPRLSAGITLKAASSELFERASAGALALDAGIIYEPERVGNLSLAAAVQNIGTSTEFINKANPLPSAAHAGGAYWMDIGTYYITPGFDITFIFKEDRFIPELGFEAGTGPVSFNTGLRMDVDEAAWHFGLTWLQESYDIAYAYLPGGNLDPVHRVSIGYRFDRPGPGPDPEEEE